MEAVRLWHESISVAPSVHKLVAISTIQPILLMFQSARNPNRYVSSLPKCFSAALGALLLGGALVPAQTLIVRFPFDDAPGGTTTPSDTSGGGASVTLNMLNGAGTATDFHGAPGSGISGGTRALDFHSATSQPPQTGTLNSPIALVTGNAALGIGTVSSYTVSEWVKLDSLITGGVAPRLFNYGPGSSPGDVGAANSIGAKFNSTTVVRFQIGASTADATFSGFVTNQWYFFAATYDGSTLVIYSGTETSPAAVVSSTSLSGLSAALGASAYLSIGNRGTDRARGFDGWIDDFRFYTGAGDLAFVEAIRKSQAPISIGSVYPNSANVFQVTNTFSFSASSANGINPSGIHLTLNGTDVSGSLVIGGTSTSRTVTYSGLETNKLYSGSITISDSAGFTSTAVLTTFDTFDPANYTWECEDYDYGGGLFFDNPQTNAYAGLPGITNIDYIDANANNANTYRGDDMSTGVAGDALRAAYNGTGSTDYTVGFFSTGSALNYTRHYPVGLYNIYVRAANGAAGTPAGNFSILTNGWGTTTQSGTNLGTVSVPPTGGWGTYGWFPIRDTAGNLVKFNPTGTTNTIRLTSAGEANYNFFLLAPANTNLPTLSGLYPDGTVQFQPTNKLVFTASSAAGINSNAIQVALSITNITTHLTTNLFRTNGLTVTGSSTSWAVSLSLVTNAAYIATISVLDQNNNSASTTVRFDTYDPAFTWEAEDYDYNNGQFISTPQTNGYLGLAGVSGVDFVNLGNANETFVYRPVDGGVADQVAGDSPRRPYVGSGLSDYNVGWFDSGEWINFTRVFPNGAFNVYARAANGQAASSGSIALGLVTSGAGTPTQTIANLGSATIPPTGGWQTYDWMPFRDTAGNLVKFTGAGQATVRITSGGGNNATYFMLITANTNLPTISQIYPDGSKLFQSTNKFTSTVSSAAGISTSSISLTLNGVNVSPDLTFSGSSTSWVVNYSKLHPNTDYTAALSVTDANGNSASTTVRFDTFAPNNFTWEGEDYDYNSGSFIDNPQTNAYYGLSGTQLVDYYESFANVPQLQYRPSDFMGTQAAGDVQRPQYAGTNDYNIGWFTTGEWLNYTRTFPAGTRNIYVRAARGASGTVVHTLSLLSSGWGTSDQTTNDLGTFTIDPTPGWQSYAWVPLRDGSGAPVALTLNGSTNTFKLTSGGEANINFFMLVPPLNITPTLVGGSINLAFPTQPGFGYQVQYETNATDANWLNLGSLIPGDGTVKSLNDPVSRSKRFYRVQAK